MPFVNSNGFIAPKLAGVYGPSVYSWRAVACIDCRPVRSTFAVRETASLGIMGAPRVPPLNPSESIVL